MCQKIIKGCVIFDMLVEASCENSISSKEKFHYELVAWVEGDDEKKQTFYFDGSKCLKGVGAGIALLFIKGGIIPMDYKLNFDYTNNMVWYMYLVLDFKASIDLSIKNLQVYGDSKLLINQINEVYNRKDEKLQPYKDLVTNMVERCFEKV